MIARTARRRRRRAGITLTEILIAIMIMGVGLISLATLFPLGLLRMRSATQYNRVSLLFESAADEMDARALLYKSSFIQTWYGPRDPFLQDATGVGAYNGLGEANPTVAITTTSANLQSGLPIAYDPLWRAITGVVPPFSATNTSGGYYDGSLDFKTTYANEINEARFGAAVFGGATFNVRNDPDGGLPAGYGLQRLTNFIPFSTAGLTPLYNFTHSNVTLGFGTPRPDGAADVFVSPDDIVFNPIDKATNTSTTKSTSPVLPDTSGGSMVQDFRFSWFFTGNQVDVTNSSQFVGDIVVCDSRPFGFDRVTINGATQSIPSGETTVEAVFGWGTNFGQKPPPPYAEAQGAKRKVLLRWRVGVPDPQVRPGGWIADVTYDRNPTTYSSRYFAASTPASLSPPLATVVPFTRCHWYQVSQRTEAETESATSPGVNSPGNYRRMVVTLNTDVQAQTLLRTSDATPAHCNFALIMPSVINVFARAFEVHN